MVGLGVSACVCVIGSEKAVATSLWLWFAFGAGTFGQFCGRCTRRFLFLYVGNTPRVVSDKADIVQVCVGQDFSLSRSSSGAIFFAGKSDALGLTKVSRQDKQRLAETCVG